MRDFFTPDDYRYRFEVDAKQRFIEVLRARFNSGVKYRGRLLKWDTVIQGKTKELGRYLIGRSRSLDFSEPNPIPERTDNRVVREAILRLTKKEARTLGIGKSTLHYLGRNAQLRQSFGLYSTTKEKLLD